MRISHEKHRRLNKFPDFFVYLRKVKVYGNQREGISSPRPSEVFEGRRSRTRDTAGPAEVLPDGYEDNHRQGLLENRKRRQIT